jgi:hypothetical protein
MKAALEEAVAITQAQAGVRLMDDKEIQSMIQSLAYTIKGLADANVAGDDEKTGNCSRKKPRRHLVHRRRLRLASQKQS